MRFVGTKAAILALTLATSAACSGPPASCDGGCDAGPPENDAGTPPPFQCTAIRCMEDLDCELQVCVRAHPLDVEDELGAVENLPDGARPGPSVLLEGGRCAASHPSEVRCDLEAAAVGAPDGCGTCARCVANVGGLPPLCRQRCGDASDCLTGERCDAALGVCLEACESDVDCRIAREDRGRVGVFEGAAIDPLVYDDTSTARCESGSCVRPALPSPAGASCTRDSDCGGGVCVSPARAWDDPYAAAWCSVLGCERFLGGFCTTLGCGPSTPCADTDVCTTLPLPRMPGESAIAVCAPACEVGGDDCRDGYACVPNRSGGGGACLPAGRFGPGAPPIGANCWDDSDCASENGLAVCHPFDFWDELPPRAGGMCTIARCDGAPCGEGASCQWLPGMAHGLCLRVGSSELCDAGQSSLDADFDPRTGEACVPLCVPAVGCAEGQGCVTNGPGTSLGRCRSGLEGTCDDPGDLVANGTRLDDGSVTWESRMPIADSVAGCPPELARQRRVRWDPPTAGRAHVEGGGSSPVSPTASEECSFDSALVCPCPTFSCPHGGDVTYSGDGPLFINLSTETELRLFPPIEDVGASSRCDPRHFTQRCTTGLTCATRDARGPACGGAPSCADPISLNDVAAFGGRSFALVVPVPEEPMIDAPIGCSPSEPLPALVFEWTPPDNGVLHVRANIYTDAILDDLIDVAADAALGITDFTRVWVRRTCDDPTSELTCDEGFSVPQDLTTGAADVTVRAGETIFIFVGADRVDPSGPVFLRGRLQPPCTSTECVPGEPCSNDPRLHCGSRCEWPVGCSASAPCDPLAPSPECACVLVWDDMQMPPLPPSPSNLRFECGDPSLATGREGEPCGDVPLPEGGWTASCEPGLICDYFGATRECTRLCDGTPGSCGTRNCFVPDASRQIAGEDPLGFCVDPLPPCDAFLGGCAPGAVCRLQLDELGETHGLCVESQSVDPELYVCDLLGVCDQGTLCMLSPGAAEPLCHRLCSSDVPCPPPTSCLPLSGWPQIGTCVFP